MCESRTVRAVLCFVGNRVYLSCFFFAHSLESYLFASSVCMPPARAAC
jgi:hypothetical protein